MGKLRRNLCAVRELMGESIRLGGEPGFNRGNSVWVSYKNWPWITHIGDANFFMVKPSQKQSAWMSVAKPSSPPKEMRTPGDVGKLRFAP